MKVMRWRNAFSKMQQGFPSDTTGPGGSLRLGTLGELKKFLDVVHIKQCLLAPYFQCKAYPLLESKDLLPSFDSDPFEFKNLPGFSLVAFLRRVEYFQEIFQFDRLQGESEKAELNSPIEFRPSASVGEPGFKTILRRLPRQIQEKFRTHFARRDVTDLTLYAKLLPFLLEMERGQVMSLDGAGHFSLSGVYASFPSDLDRELKRFGLKIGKFAPGDSALYERNRILVYQFFMEMYGFPIVSERRTSAAVFARKLHRRGESFLVRVLGQSDRTLTTIYLDPKVSSALCVEKIALVKVERDQKEAIRTLSEGGFFVDSKKLVILLRVEYMQHKFNPGNIRQERALSVQRQEVIHPLTGECLDTLDIIKDTSNMLLRLNDIVQGEYRGRIVYKRDEVVENTDTAEKRLKFLYAWLAKHQRRIIGYSDEFFAGVAKILDYCLLDAGAPAPPREIQDLHQEVCAKYRYIKQARKVRELEDLKARMGKGGRISHLEMLTGAVSLLSDLRFEVVTYFDEIVSSVIVITEQILNDRYVRDRYFEKKDKELTGFGLEMKKMYSRLVSLLDAFRNIRKTRFDHGAEPLHSTADPSLYVRRSP